MPGAAARRAGAAGAAGAEAGTAAAAATTEFPLLSFILFQVKQSV